MGGALLAGAIRFATHGDESPPPVIQAIALDCTAATMDFNRDGVDVEILILSRANERNQVE